MKIVLKAGNQMNPLAFNYAVSAEIGTGTFAALRIPRIG
jgi:hypothetical protein